MRTCGPAVLLFTFLWLTEAIPRTVTNEDIRDAILSVVHMIRSTEDKLQRHEFRERALGEQLKKSLVTLDKRIKLLDPVKGTVSRLDERLAAVETILMQKDERERIQLQKTFDTVEDIQKILPLIVEKLKSDIIETIKSNKIELPKVEESATKKDLENAQKNLADEIDKIGKTVAKMEEDLTKLKNKSDSVNEINKQSNENLEKVKRQLNENEHLLEKYENKLAEFNNRIDVIPQNDKAENDWHTSFMQALEVQKTNVEQILSDVKSVESKINKLPEKGDVASVRNATLEVMEELKSETEVRTDKTLGVLDAKFKELQKHGDEKQADTVKSVSEMAEMIETLTDNFATSYDQLRKEVQALGKMEQVVVQTADGVLDTKRRVEYGVHQILLEVGELVKGHSKEVNATINERFNNFEGLILDEETGALANLTASIGEEIDQVWRQIGIMHQQMSASTDTLNKLQNQTHTYVNGSLNVMDSMEGKVGQITSRMTEVDDNLNYLLGRLSFVTREFNQLKTGLGKALDEMKGSFQEVQQKVKDKGPGPHQIASNEVDIK